MKNNHAEYLQENLMQLEKNIEDKVNQQKENFNG